MNEAQRQDFEWRVVAYQDGGLGEEQLAELEVEMREDPEKLQRFINVQRQTGAMIELFRNDAFRTSEEPQDGVPLESAGNRLGPWQRTSWIVVALGGIAACLMLGWSFGFRNDTPRKADLAVAQSPPQASRASADLAPSLNTPASQTRGPLITYADEASWSDGRLRMTQDQLAYDQPYRLLTGATRIRMEGGAIVSIGAPAAFRIIDSVTLRLANGRLTARLPDEQSDLKVLTGDLQVRDLGTAFGLTVKANGQVDVAVFDGKVSARLNDQSDPTEEQTFSQGKAFSADSLSNRLNEIPYDPGSYQDIWPLTVGINEVTDLIEFVPPGTVEPLSSLTNDHKLFLVAERLNCPVKENVSVGLLGAGLSWPMTNKKRRWVAKGNTVNSYLLMFQPDEIDNHLPVSVSGSITFQNQILGIAVSPSQLRYTNEDFGLPGLDYSQFAWRRLEHIETGEGQVPADMLRISEDGRQLQFHLHASSGTDHIRVLVNESPLDPRRTSDDENVFQEEPL